MRCSLLIAAPLCYRCRGKKRRMHPGPLRGDRTVSTSLVEPTAPWQVPDSRLWCWFRPDLRAAGGGGGGGGGGGLSRNRTAMPDSESHSPRALPDESRNISISLVTPPTPASLASETPEARRSTSRPCTPRTFGSIGVSRRLMDGFTKGNAGVHGAIFNIFQPRKYGLTNPHRKKPRLRVAITLRNPGRFPRTQTL